MSMYRSEKMVLCQLLIPPEAAYDTISDLGELGIVQFRNLNNESEMELSKKFSHEVRLCHEMERKLKFIKFQLKLDKINIPELKYGEYPLAPNQKDFSNIESIINTAEEDINHLSEISTKLKLNYLDLLNKQYVLEKTNLFFDSENNQAPNRNITGTRTFYQKLVQEKSYSSLNFISGMVDRERSWPFQTMLWRLANGNLYYHDVQVDEPFENPQTGEKCLRNVFIMCGQGDKLKSAYEKVCKCFGADIYDCPTSQNERDAMLKSIKLKLADLNIILKETHDFRTCVLAGAANNLYKMICQVRKTKAIFHSLNCFTYDSNCLIGECWIPKLDLPKLHDALELANRSAGSNIKSIVQEIKTDITPPTFIRTNKFTCGFQNLIDSYGIGTYREINPGLYTIITFPFLFAVMFGDIGHGLIILLFAAWMCLYEKRLIMHRHWGEIWDTFFSGRYIILLMGIFSIYTGIVYNDIFSKSLKTFNSAWRVNYNFSTIINSTGSIELNPARNDLIDGYTYPIGADPVWRLSKSIKFSNSYKMKVSIIIGVVHMFCGVLLSAINMINFKKYQYIVLQFIPQILFLTLIFGYMVFMIFYKWIYFTAKTNDVEYSQGCAPSILIMFINMMLFKNYNPPLGCKEYMFNGQHELQLSFVMIAFLCIPWLFLGKPLYIIYTRKMMKKNVKLNEEDGIEIDQASLNSGDGNPFDSEEANLPMVEIFIHSGILTVEYILSTISHTASYLRLWALALAHAELSKVIWNLIFRRAFTGSVSYVGVFTIIFYFVPFAFLTLTIMVMMEPLSAFLHCLRLHWVEFMSKFYTGLGYKFLPLRFDSIMDEPK